MAFPAILNLATLTPDVGFRVNGLEAADFFGWAMQSAGDFNGDGIDDFMLTARGHGSGGQSIGAAYIIFGRSGGFAGGVDVATLDGTNGFTIQAETVGGFFGWDAAHAGDVNGDGRSDIIVSQVGGAPNGNFSGYVYVFFGSSSPFNANFDLDDVNGSNGFRLSGPEASSFGGWAVNSAGDFNGDGFDDVAITAYAADSNGANAGSVWVVYGRSTGFPANINLSDLNGANGFRLTGGGAGTELGGDVASGDLNGDGYDDLVIGGPGANSAYVVYGRGGMPASSSVAGLNGTNGFTLVGVAAFDRPGMAVMMLDFNGDGYDDALVGAYAADTNGGSSGDSYLVFGAASGIPSSVSLATLNGTNGFRIGGVAFNDRSGRSLAALDVNGDGYEDMLISARGSDTNGSDSGAAYIIYGRSGPFNAVFNLASIDGTNGFRMYGEVAGDQLGTGVGWIGDVNGDGVDDFAVGSPYADPSGSNSGAAYIIYGQLDVRDFFGGNADDNFTGGALADSIHGNRGKDTLRGLGGDDEISGGDGNDQLFGGDGADTLTGGLGNDSLDGGANDDILFDASGANKLNGGDGHDTVTGGAGADRLDGGSGNDALTGGGGNDYLDGGTGTNSLAGGLGNDIFIVRSATDSVVEAAGQGSDTVRSMISYTLTENVERLEFLSGVALNGTGNAVANALVGNNAANILSGMDGADILEGGGGNDTLIGGVGRDQLSGGAGGDTFRVLQESLGQAAIEIDRIIDFNAADGDRLDFSLIDADGANTNGDQAFTVVGAFNRTPGQLFMFYTVGQDLTTIRLDQNGDGKADYQLTVNGDLTGASGTWLL